MPNLFNRAFMRFILFFALFPSFLFAQDFSKIDAALLERGKTHKTLPFVLFLNQQADISGAQRIFGKEAKGQFVYEQLTRFAQSSQTELLAKLDALQLPHQSFWLINAIKSEGTLADIQSLSTSKTVRFVAFDAPIKKATAEMPFEAENYIPNANAWGIDKIKAPDAWAAGATGQNVVVAGQDTGYRWEHEALKAKYRGWNGTTASHDYNWHDAIREEFTENSPGANPCGLNVSAPCDDDGHGTHTMGTMVGSTPAEGIGVAPDAKWIACRNMDSGNGRLTSYMECFQWFLAPTKIDGTGADVSKAPHVINNSWYCDVTEGCNTSNVAPMETLIQNLQAAGIVVVVSAGNKGSACSTVADPPAYFASSYSIGNTDSTDKIASSSSRGPSTYTNGLKPNVSAPGSNIRSSYYSSNNAYTNLTGTSMAGPHVAGLVALIISANPEILQKPNPVQTIQTIINETADVPSSPTNQECGGIPATTFPNNVYGYGRINAHAAVLRAKSLALPTLEDTFELTEAPYILESRYKSFSLRVKNTQTVVVNVYDALGRRVKQLENSNMLANTANLIEFSGLQLAKGVYFVHFVGEEFTTSRSVVVQ